MSVANGLPDVREPPDLDLWGLYGVIAEVIQDRAVCVAGWPASFSMPHCPGSHPGDPVHADVGDVARRRVVYGREAGIRPEIGTSEFLEKLSGSSLGDAGSAVDDQVFVQAHGVALAGLDGQRDAAVAADVAHLAVLGKVGRHDLIAVETDPDDAHLGAAVPVQGHQVRQGWGLQHRSGAVGQGPHELKLAADAHRRLSGRPSLTGVGAPEWRARASLTPRDRARFSSARITVPRVG